MYNTEIMQILTLCAQLPLSLRHHLKVIVSLASIEQPKMWMSSSMISLQPYICIMHVVISDNIIINNNNFINLLQGLLTYKSWSMKKKWEFLNLSKVPQITKTGIKGIQNKGTLLTANA